MTNATTEKKIIEAALAARTPDDATAVQKLIREHIGQTWYRPVADRPNNMGLLTQSGSSFDHKAIEPITNMQDHVLERLALERYGSPNAVPFDSPHNAARSLLGGLDERAVAELATAEIFDDGTDREKHLTLVFRDQGTGITPASVPQTIFRLGSSYKIDIPWFQGAFGLGGATSYRNADYVILVTRRAPSILDEGEEDRITVAVLEWQSHGKTKGLLYLVTTEFRRDGDTAEPWSAPTSACPDFAAGLHLALIGYGVEGFHRKRSDDEKAMPTVINTRLFDPVFPIKYTDQRTRGKVEVLRGLKRRFADNPRGDRREGSDLLPFKLNGTTYQLPVSYYVFAAPGSNAGTRRGFVASGHGLIITSNGQAHTHWTPEQFRRQANQINKLHDRILVVVEADELPIEVRTDIFTADRSSGIRNETMIRLESAVGAFLNEWHELRDINSEIIREAITKSSQDEPTISIARRISRALRTKGFSLGGAGTGGGGGRGGAGGIRRVIDLYDNPTTIEGPETVQVERDKTRSITYVINAVDDFIPRRTDLNVVFDHPDVTDQDITVSRLRAGRIRVSMAIPDTAALGFHGMVVSIQNWVRSDGGLGKRLEWETKVEVVDEIVGRGRGNGRSGGRDRASPGNLVALKWTSHTQQEGEEWDKVMVGEVMPVAASLLAEQPEYEEFAELGDREIPTILLNQEYTHLKSYIHSRVATASEAAVKQAKERYAVAVGVALLLVQDQVDRAAKKGQTLPTDWVKASKQAAARGALSLLPEYDKLLEEIDVD